MSTRSIVTLIKRQAPDWTRVEILDLVNDVVQIMLRKPTSLTRMFTTDGTDPILTTVAGTRRYELAASSTCFNYANGAFFVSDVYKSRNAKFANNVFAIPEDSYIPTTFIQNATGASAAIVTFVDDPGTSTFYVRAYAQPADITSETATMPIPVEWQMRAVVDGVIGMIERMEHGKSERWDTFISDILPEFWNSSDTTGNTLSYEIAEVY